MSQLDRWEARPGRTTPAAGSSRNTGAPTEAAGALPDLGWYWQVLRSRSRVVLGVLGSTMAAVALGTLLQTPVYRATGMIEVRQRSADVASVNDLFESGKLTSQYLDTQMGILRSAALARRVLRDVGVTDPGDFDARHWSTQAHPARRGSPVETEAMLNEFQSRLIIDPVSGSSLVRADFDAADPVVAARVVNSLFANYVAMRVDAGREAERQLTEQVNDVRTDLARAEGKLQAYSREHGLVFLEGGAGQADNTADDRLRQLQEQLTAAEVDRYAKQSLYDLTTSQGPDALTSDVLQALRVQAAQLTAEYARLRSTFTDDYPRAREVHHQLAELETQIAREQQRIRERIRSDYTSAQRREALLRSAVTRQEGLNDQLAEDVSGYQLLRRDVEGHQQLYQLLQQKQKAAGVSAALAATEVNVINPAVPPETPVQPQPGRNLQLALLVGLFLGVGLAFTREYTASVIRRVEDIDSVSTIPVLGAIPSAGLVPRSPARSVEAAVSRVLPIWTAGTRKALADPERSGAGPDLGLVAEAFAGLRTSVLLNASRGDVRSILITSTQPREGKTTVSLNLAISLARVGRRVLLVDADIRHPSVLRALKLTRDRGLTDVLSAGVDWRTLLVPDVVPGLDVLPTGSSRAAPSELLASTRMADLIRGAEAEYDLVVVDSPALLINAADARILAALTDGVVLVVRSGVTPKQAMARVCRAAPELRVFGVVLNDLDWRGMPQYYGYPASRAPAHDESPVPEA